MTSETSIASLVTVAGASREWMDAIMGDDFHDRNVAFRRDDERRPTTPRTDSELVDAVARNFSQQDRAHERRYFGDTRLSPDRHWAACFVNCPTTFEYAIYFVRDYVHGRLRDPTAYGVTLDELVAAAPFYSGTIPRGATACELNPQLTLEWTDEKPVTDANDADESIDSVVCGAGETRVATDLQSSLPPPTSKRRRREPPPPPPQPLGPSIDMRHFALSLRWYSPPPFATIDGGDDDCGDNPRIHALQISAPCAPLAAISVAAKSRAYQCLTTLAKPPERLPSCVAAIVCDYMDEFSRFDLVAPPSVRSARRCGSFGCRAIAELERLAPCAVCATHLICDGHWQPHLDGSVCYHCRSDGSRAAIGGATTLSEFS